MNSRMKLLIGYDGSQSADAILADLRRAGLPDEAEAMVLSVAELWLASSQAETEFAEIFKSELEFMEKLSSQACAQIRSSFPKWDVHTKVETGSPAWRIIEVADEWQPDLIIVGSQGRSAIERLIFGSVSQRVVTDAHCSVRVSRPHTQEVNYPPRIIIGIDGSIGAEAAARAVARRIWPAGSEMRLIISLGLSIPGVSNSPLAKTLKESHDHAEGILSALKTELSSTGLTVSTAIKEGDPKRVLISEADDWGADCIFLGSRGLGRIKRFLLGSVSTAVVARAHCSVEVVRTKEEAATP